MIEYQWMVKIMNGIIVVNKNRGITSHDVVNQIRKIFYTKKVGHLGTLDPNATGVLVVAINDATKLVQYLENDDKVYEAEIILGISTDTYDLEGKVLAETKLDNIDEVKIDQCLNSFLGNSMQQPPIYSAIKKDGKKLYEYARNNQSVKIDARPITIYDIHRISDIIYHQHYVSFSIFVHVSKGTYIRSLANDIGKRLSVPSCMGNLKRIASGIWNIEQAKSIEEIQKNDFIIYSMLEALKKYPMLEEEDCIIKAKNGQKISGMKVKNILGDNPEIIVIKEKDILIGIYHYDKEIKGYRAGRVWN